MRPEAPVKVSHPSAQPGSMSAFEARSPLSHPLRRPRESPSELTCGESWNILRSACTRMLRRSHAGYPGMKGQCRSMGWSSPSRIVLSSRTPFRIMELPLGPLEVAMASWPVAQSENPSGTVTLRMRRSRSTSAMTSAMCGRRRRRLRGGRTLRARVPLVAARSRRTGRP